MVKVVRRGRAPSSGLWAAILHTEAEIFRARLRSLTGQVPIAATEQAGRAVTPVTLCERNVHIKSSLSPFYQWGWGAEKPLFILLLHRMW